MSQLRTIVKKLIPTSLFRAIEPIGHGVEAWLMAARFGFPARKMRIIGVTGTNGKTTTSAMIHRMLVEAGHTTGLSSTAMYGINHDLTIQTEHMTTQSAYVLQKRLREFARAGVEFVVLETTSHALAQHRVNGIRYEIAVGTNITHEHLDYHGTFARYKAAKRKLFENAAHSKKGFGIYNADDENSDVFAGVVRSEVAYGVEHGALRAQDITQTADHSTFTAVQDERQYHIQVHLPGIFNVYNALAAVAVGQRVGLSQSQIEHGLSALKTVPGRMQVVNAGQSFRAVVDFAHTPDSFELLLSDLRAQTKGKLVVLFGSAGRRDEAKRYTQGEIAGKYADAVVLTEEDDRDVPGEKITKQIKEGILRSSFSSEKIHTIPRRDEAIQYAVSLASSADDTVAFLGKGHERTIERPEETIAWDEVAQVEAAIKSSKRA